MLSGAEGCYSPNFTSKQSSFPTFTFIKKEHEKEHFPKNNSLLFINRNTCKEVNKE